jgi:hypothetical protein
MAKHQLKSTTVEKKEESASLTTFFHTPTDNGKQEIKDRITFLRRLMLVHSCIYYELNDNVISDHQWQSLADELEKLQKDNPDCCKVDFFDWNFRDWDGATGAHLPHRHPWVYNKAKYVIWLRDNRDKYSDARA